jgi:hypothetical protein
LTRKKLRRKVAFSDGEFDFLEVKRDGGETDRPGRTPAPEKLKGSLKHRH